MLLVVGWRNDLPVPGFTHQCVEKTLCSHVGRRGFKLDCHDPISLLNQLRMILISIIFIVINRPMIQFFNELNITL